MLMIVDAVQVPVGPEAFCGFMGVTCALIFASFSPKVYSYPSRYRLCLWLGKKQCWNMFNGCTPTSINT